MRILADENIQEPSLGFLRELGHDFRGVNEAGFFPAGVGVEQLVRQLVPPKRLRVGGSSLAKEDRLPWELHKIGVSPRASRHTDGGVGA